MSRPIGNITFLQTMYEGGKKYSNLCQFIRELHATFQNNFTLTNTIYQCVLTINPSTYGYSTQIQCRLNYYCSHLKVVGRQCLQSCLPISQQWKRGSLLHFIRGYGIRTLGILLLFDPNNHGMGGVDGWSLKGY